MGISGLVYMSWMTRAGRRGGEAPVDAVAPGAVVTFGVSLPAVAASSGPWL